MREEPLSRGVEVRLLPGGEKVKSLKGARDHDGELYMGGSGSCISTNCGDCIGRRGSPPSVPMGE